MLSPGIARVPIAPEIDNRQTTALASARILCSRYVVDGTGWEGRPSGVTRFAVDTPQCDLQIICTSGSQQAMSPFLDAVNSRHCHAMAETGYLSTPYAWQSLYLLERVASKVAI